MGTQHTAYQEHIITDPGILAGKPVVRGTRIPVELVLDHLAQNLDLADLFAAYPRLTIDDVKACLAYAQALVEGQDVTPAPPRRPRGRAASSV
ncbi:MAG: DUF433 domain-containing protein [Dehalococcoidia bacterium]